MVLKCPKHDKEEHPESLQKNIRSAHYNPLSTTQRPQQTPCIIPQDRNRMFQPNKQISLEVCLLSSYFKFL